MFLYHRYIPGHTSPSYPPPSPLQLFWTHTDVHKQSAEQNKQKGDRGQVEVGHEPLQIPEYQKLTSNRGFHPRNTGSSVRNCCYLLYTGWAWKLKCWTAAKVLYSWCICGIILCSINWAADNSRNLFFFILTCHKNQEWGCGIECRTADILIPGFISQLWMMKSFQSQNFLQPAYPPLSSPTSVTSFQLSPLILLSHKQPRLVFPLSSPYCSPLTSLQKCSPTSALISLCILPSILPPPDHPSLHHFLLDATRNQPEAPGRPESASCLLVASCRSHGGGETCPDTERWGTNRKSCT